MHINANIHGKSQILKHDDEKWTTKRNLYTIPYMSSYFLVESALAKVLYTSIVH